MVGVTGSIDKNLLVQIWRKDKDFVIQRSGIVARKFSEWQPVTKMGKFRDYAMMPMQAVDQYTSLA